MQNFKGHNEEIVVWKEYKGNTVVTSIISLTPLFG